MHHAIASIITAAALNSLLIRDFIANHSSVFVPGRRRPLAIARKIIRCSLSMPMFPKYARRYANDAKIRKPKIFVSWRFAFDEGGLAPPD
jgi:hypothetical protein